MTDIASLGRSQAAAYTAPAASTPREVSNPTAAPKREGDAVQFSSAAQYLSKLGETPQVREELIASVRASIAQGNYESEEKLDIAVDRLIDDLA